MKARFSYVLTIIVSLSLLQCKKAETSNATTNPSPNPGQVTVTIDSSLHTSTTITVFCNVSALAGVVVNERGICFSTTNTQPSTADHKVTAGTGTGSFTVPLPNISPSTLYWFRAYAIVNSEVIYSPLSNAQTDHQAAPPTLTLNPIISPISSEATLEADINDSGYAPIIAKGFCWSTTPTPTISNTTLPEGSGYEFGYFNGTTFALTANTTYYFRAYATNSAGTGYSNELTLTTTYHLGEGLGGGRIFYIDGTGLHGLIGALTDQTNGGKWNNTNNPFTWINAYDFNNGSANTTNIVAVLGNNGSAAALCRSYTGGGYTDWYLPSANELYTLYLQQNLFGNFFATNYWSSTASSSDNSIAYVQDFGSGYYDERFKSEVFPVRAIRAF